MSEHDIFVAIIMSMWDQKLDTAQMAKSTLRPEAHCALALRIGREQRMSESAA